MRSFVIIVGLVCLAAGAIALSTGTAPPALVFLGWGIILIGGIAFERFRYKPVTTKPVGPNWKRTDERFVDEETGKIVTVYIRPDTGERAYVRE